MSGQMIAGVRPELFRGMLDDIGDGIIMTDRHERILYINKAAVRILGVDGNLPEGASFSEVCPLVDLSTGEPFPSPLRQAMDTEKAVGLRRNIGLNTPGGAVYLSATCSPVHHGGEVTGCSVILRDITQIRRLEMNIEADHMYMRSIFEVAHVGLCILNTAGEIVEINDAALRIMHTAHDLAIGLQFGDAFRCENSLAKGCGHGDNCRFCPVRKNIEAAIMDETFQNDFTVVMNSPRTNKPEWMQLFVSQVSLGGADRNIIVSLIDVTAREERKAQLEKARLRAEHESRLKGQFMATISHEIRTPINGMIGMIDLTLRGDMTAEQRENMESAKVCAQDLLLIINDILDYSKIESGHMELENISFDLHSQLRQVIKIHAKVAESRALFFKVPEMKALPQFIRGDPLRLRQILNNLLTNALKFTSEGGVSLEAEVKHAPREILELRVRDTGIGISAEEQEKLFKPFSQVDGTITRRFGGTGLGLAIVKELITAMQGEITVESTQGKGSVFICRLPLKLADAATDEGGRQSIILNPRLTKEAPPKGPKGGADDDIASLLKYCEDKLKE